jgi:hypothetical protein
VNQLLELRIKNFLGIKAASIVPGDGVTEIVGDEGSGKTSILRAIWTALGGAANLPEQPIREGAMESDIYLDLGDIRVAWHVETGRPVVLKLTAKDGSPIKKEPQTLLNSLRGHLSFDPLAFDRLDDGTAKGKRVQAELLRKLASLDTSDLDAEIARLTTEYTPVNTSAERMEAVAGSVRVPEAPVEAGTERPVVDVVDVVAIAAKKGDVERVRADNERQRAAAVQARRHHEAQGVHVSELKRKIAALRDQLNDALPALVRLDAEAVEQEARAAALVDPDTSLIDREIAAAKFANQSARAEQEEYNRMCRAAHQAHAERVRALAERTQRAAEAAAERQRANVIKARKAAALAERQARIAAAKFPVDGLSVDGDVVTWKGRPYSQVNTSQRIPLCCSIGAALNPGLKFITIEHGNDIGKKVMPQIDAWARERGYRILVERLEGTGAACVVIEDGGVRSAAPEDTADGWQ